MWRRAIVVAAGADHHFVVAIPILAAFAVTLDENRTPTVVAGVAAESGAAEAGLLRGDRILAIDGRAVETFNDVHRYVIMPLDEPVELTVERAEVQIAFDAQIGVRTERDRFGNEISPGPARRRAERSGADAGDR